MGYTTEFEGRFKLDRPMAPEHAAYINKFAETRRMARDEFAVNGMPDPIRLAVGLPVGIQGEFFVGGGGMFGQDRDPSILDYNREPLTQPGLWCKWVVSEDLSHIEWSGAEKFYGYTEWLRYICKNFLKDWGYTLNGEVTWSGEQQGDVGVLRVVNNEVTAQAGRVRSAKPASKRYDPACLDLAMTFIADSRIPAADHERLADELAQAIQCEIELFLDDNEPEEES